MAPVAARRACKAVEPTGLTSAMKRQKKIKIEKKINKTMKRLKADMAKISTDQRCIREEQRKIREKLEEIGSQCAQLREETALILKQRQGTKFSSTLSAKLSRQDKMETLKRPPPWPAPYVIY